MKIIIAIIVFGILVAVHEFGHYIIAKLNNTKIREFAIGMGKPILFQKKIGETVYSLRALPIGGFCDFAEDEIDEEDDDPRSFNNKSPWVRMSIVLAGPVFNFILAFLIYVVAIGITGYSDNKITDVKSGTPAALAGIQKEDRILEVDGQKINIFGELRFELFKYQQDGERKGNPLSIKLQRDDRIMVKEVTPYLDEETGSYVLGVMPNHIEDVSILKSFQYGSYEMKYVASTMIYGLKELVTGNISRDEVSGPVGIVRIVGQTAEQGLIELATFAAYLSINLGIINLVPIPALDGSRFLIALTEGITRRRVNRKVEAYFHTIGFIGLMILMVYITYGDIRKIFI